MDNPQTAATLATAWFAISFTAGGLFVYFLSKLGARK